MGYKGTMRSIGAAVRAAERDSKRRQREYDKKAKQLQKMQELERAKFEVEQYENDLEVKLSLHKELSGYNWMDINKAEKPIEPEYIKSREEKAKHKLDTFKPGLFDKLLGGEDKKIAELESKLEKAILRDKNEYEETYKKWKNETEEYESVQSLYNGISTNDRTSYKMWFDLVNPFEEVMDFGTSISINYNKEIVTADISSCRIEIIPETSKTLLKSGKLSEKVVSVSKRNDIYQDYISSESIRVAREIFEMIPVDEIIVNSKLSLLNKSTGYHEESIVLSVFYVRETMMKINYELIDPSDALSNFIHNMKFKKTTGFEAVQEIER